MTEEKCTQRISFIELDDKTIISRNEDIENERRVAIFDLLENNYFAPKSSISGDYLGPYNILIRMEDNRLAIDLYTETNNMLSTVVVPLSTLRAIIKEYFLICDNYYTAIKKASTRRIEAIDLGRRSLHDEGAEILRARIMDKIDIDFNTARRLFTLICIMQIR